MTTPEEARELIQKHIMESPVDITLALNDLANQVERLEAQRKELREALQCMLIEQEREGFGDEMPDIKNARAALKATQ